MVERVKSIGDIQIIHRLEGLNREKASRGKKGRLRTEKEKLHFLIDWKEKNSVRVRKGRVVTSSACE